MMIIYYDMIRKTIVTELNVSEIKLIHNLLMEIKHYHK